MKTLLNVIVAIIFTLPVWGQHPNIIIDDNQMGYDPCEPTIIINPKQPDHIVAGAIIDRYYYSTDGGYSWSVGYLSSPYGVWGDPCVVVDTAGSYHYMHLSNPVIGNWIDRIVSQKADQIGDNWNEGTYMGLNGDKAQDKEWAVVDMDNNNIYVSWTQFDDYGSWDTTDKSNIHFSRSTDGGLTWSEAIRINEVSGDCLDDDNTVEGAVPAVGPNGEVYVAWVGPEGIVLDKSLDQGLTWLDEDIYITDVPGGWAFNIPGISRCNGLPITKCDLSGGPYHGTIYVNWSDQRNGTDDTDVWLAKSTDGGETWSTPVRVNDDPPGKQQFFTWMDVDQVTGDLWFVWYDRRNYNDNNTDVYMAVSRDGGESFINFKVSETPFLPSSNYFFGDYTNISAYNNVVRPIWTSLDEGFFTIWTAIVNTEIVGTEEQLVDLFSVEQNYPNPFKESTVLSFKLQNPSIVNLEVFDVFGRKVATLYKNQFLHRGKYTEIFRPKQYQLSPGVYFFSLSSENQAVKRKMLYLE